MYRLNNMKQYLPSLGALSMFSLESYKQLFPRLPDNVTPATAEFTAEVNERAQKTGLTHPLTVYRNEPEGGNWLQGIRGPRQWNRMCVVLEKPDKNAFIISHEIAHAKNNDLLMPSIIRIIFTGLLFTKIPMGYSLFTYISTTLAYLRHAEKRADLTAAQSCNNIEIMSYINRLHQVRENNLHYRNSENKNLLDEIIKKTQISSTGDPLFEASLLLFDAHPSHTNRIKYLTQFIAQRPDEYPNIEVYYQKEANGTFSHACLTFEQSSLLRKIIKNSPQKETFGALTKIVLLPGDSTGNVQLFNEGTCFPVPYNFEPWAIRDKQLLPAIIEAIVHSEATEIFAFESQADGNKKPTFLSSYKTSGALKEAEAESAQVLKLSHDNPAFTADKSKNYDLMYDVKPPLNLTSEQCFESLVMLEPQLRF